MKEDVNDGIHRPTPIGWTHIREQMTETLQAYGKPQSNDEWEQFAKAIYHASDGSKPGYEVLRDWSEKSAGEPIDERCAALWGMIDAEHGNGPDTQSADIIQRYGWFDKASDGDGQDEGNGSQDVDLLELARTYADIDPTPFFKVLADLELWQYGRARTAIAEALNLGAGILDKEVAKRRPKEERDISTQGEIVGFDPPEPWPEAVDGAELLDEISDVFDNFLILPKHANTILALWSVYTHVFDAFDVAPRLLLTSPTAECGKSIVMEILEVIAARGSLELAPSPASLYRGIHEEWCTLLLDEVDQWPKETQSAMQGFLNGGHYRQSAKTRRIEKVGERMVAVWFRIWCPMAFAGIKRVHDGTRRRPIEIRMEKKRRVDKVKHEWSFLDHAADLRELRHKAERWRWITSNDSANGVPRSRMS